MNRREYEKLMSKDKKDLVRMIMGDNAYLDAISQVIVQFF
jgi:succinate dehydrogenase flavin-adding protein (antitoxin of CptAB toxin-antitoxin module)